ncbi:endonuclease/exonuclease/phosphatase family metal-dependent hydrolase [Hydrogenispora ethanolica]|uniref:Endonuclease/exonuclease/phosphatase family metal-dependent hydrolase n=1 Tax=Hydrogenispora ethanolica TaxID=1082276 RepID=A0A4R1RK01_HYDET|nr:endonuclease/exonuclease/phosphatase family metal-dependent hydrolase [Hydrogenispora ethanolica]
MGLKRLAASPGPSGRPRPAIPKAPYRLAVYIIGVFIALFLGVATTVKAESALEPGPDETVSLKILTLNIHSGVNWFGQYDLESIARYIEEVQPDIVGLQEVARGWSSQSRFEDIPGDLARRLKMDFAYSASLERNNGNFGNLILSRYPIVGIFTELMPGNLERRSFGFVQIMVGGVRINFLTTHLGLSESDRQEQVTAIWNFISQVDGPLVITGDFNGSDGDVAVKAFHGSFLDVQELSGFRDRGTFRVKNGSLIPRMDFIFASPEFMVSNFWIDENYISDHLPLVAELKLTVSNQDVAGQPVMYQ